MAKKAKTKKAAPVAKKQPETAPKAPKAQKITPDNLGGSKMRAFKLKQLADNK